MLHIILLILKIIGIVLLSIIGIILLALICVLFVPVRYRIRVTREEGEDSPPVTAYVKVTWLLHLINVLVRYPAKLIVRARILIFTLFRIPEQEKKAHKEQKSKKSSAKKKSQKEKQQEEQVQESEEQTVQADSEVQEGAAVTVVSEPYEAFGDAGEDLDGHEAEDSGEDEANPSFFAKIKQIVKKIKAFLQNIRYTIRKLCDKIKAVLDNIQYYRDVLESEPFRRSMNLCKDELAWMFKKLKPDKFEADLIVGMEDPAATGEILAVCGILYPLIGPHVRVVGDFECEKMRIEGRLYIRGKIRVFTFLRIVIRIFFNRNIKQLIKLLKKEAV